MERRKSLVMIIMQNAFGFGMTTGRGGEGGGGEKWMSIIIIIMITSTEGFLLMI